MTEDEIKEELGIHLAKAILAQSVDGKRRVFEVVIAMCTFLIPSYIGLLKIFQNELNAVDFYIKLFPVFVWVIVLTYAIYNSIPKERAFDFKDLDSIIGDHLNGSNKSRVIGIISVLAAVIALVEAVSLIFLYAIV